MTTKTPRPQRPGSRRTLYALLTLLAALAGVYLLLPPSWFEIPEEAPAGRGEASPPIAPGSPPPPQTLEQLRAAAASAPLDYSVRSRYGMALASAGQSDAALKEFQAAARLAPESPLVHHNLGVFYLNTNQPDKADAAFLRELELAPGDGRAHHYRGLALQARRRYPEAAAQFQLATRLSPDLPDPYLALATLLTEKRPPQEIKSYVDEYLRTGGANKGLAYHALSRAYRSKQEYDTAIRYAEMATQAEPNNYAYWRNLGQLHSFARRYDDADRTLRKAAQLARNPSPVYIEIGMNAQKAGRFPEAIQALQKALELSPKTGNIHLYLARVYQRTGDQEAARREEAAYRAWERENVLELNRRQGVTQPPPKAAE